MTEFDPDDFCDLWDRYMGEDEDLDFYGASGWDMERLHRDLSARGLTGEELANVAERIAEGLEEWGYSIDGMDGPDDVKALTLTTVHEGVNREQPVMLVDGGAIACGPNDMTPAGVTGAELLSEWAARYSAPDRLAELEELLRLIWNVRISWSKNTRDLFIVTIGENLVPRIQTILGETKGRRRDTGMPLRSDDLREWGEIGPDAYPNVFQPPLTAATVRAALHRGLPEGCRVSTSWQDPNGVWVIDLVDKVGQVLAQVVPYAPPFPPESVMPRIKSNAPDYHATVVALAAGGLMMMCQNEDGARPWVRLLTGAGVALHQTRVPGRYCFNFDDRPDLTEDRPDLAENRPAPAMNEVQLMLRNWNVHPNDVRESIYRAASPAERERWHALWLLAQGWSVTQVAEAVVRAEHTITDWLNSFRRWGPAGLAFEQTGGSPPPSTRLNRPS